MPGESRAIVLDLSTFYQKTFKRKSPITCKRYTEGVKCMLYMKRHHPDTKPGPPGFKVTLWKGSHQSDLSRDVVGC